MGHLISNAPSMQKTQPPSERYRLYRSLYRDGAYAFAGKPPGKWFAPTEDYENYKVYHLMLPKVGRVSIGAEVNNLMVYYYDFNELCGQGEKYARYYPIDWRHFYYSDLWRLIGRMRERENTIPEDGQTWSFYIAEHWAIRTLPIFDERRTTLVAI